MVAEAAIPVTLSRSMVAILGGLGAALSWAIATLASSRSSRMIGPMSVLGWVMAVGWWRRSVPALLAKPVAARSGRAASGSSSSGLSHNLGLLLAYRALSIGRVSIVAPIVATEGALAAVHLRRSSARPLGVATAVAARGDRGRASSSPPPSAPVGTTPIRVKADRGAHRATAALFAIAAALTFSIGLVLARPARRGGHAAGLGDAGVPHHRRHCSSCCRSSLTRRFRLTRPALPLVVLAGVLEVFGGAIYVVAASDGVAVAAVLSSQFAAHRRASAGSCSSASASSASRSSASS